MTTILTPYDLSAPTQTGSKFWRKRVLPIGSIDYNGRKIDFTKDYLSAMVQAFNDRAFDQVPLMLATDDNRHNNNPNNFRGEVVSLDMSDDGLYATVTTTDEGLKLLQTNPSLGISARIINEYDRADGKHYSAAMQHALLTLDPRIPGLGGWKSVDSFSSDDDCDKLDLTAEIFAVKRKKTKEKSVPKKDNALSETELERLRSFLAELDEDSDDDNSDDVTDSADDELTDAELADLLAALEADESDSETADEPELEDASLSNSNDNTALELAQQHATELSRIRGELDDERWTVERERFMKKLGLPPAVVDLAKPLLKGTGHTIDLANNETVDAGKIMRDVLNEVGKQVKLLDLGNELGSEFEQEPDVSEEAASRRDETTKAVRAMMGN